MTSRMDLENRYYDVDALLRLGIDPLTPLSELRTAIGVTGLTGELIKLYEERKLMHQLLSDEGIPDHSPDGTRMCLLGRVNLLAARHG